MKHLFRPNAAVSREVYLGAAAAEVLLVLAVWWVLKPTLFPTPAGVVRGLGTLWTTGVLTDQLLRSVALNAKAVGLSALLSLALAWATVVPAARPAVGAVTKLRFLGLTGLTLPLTVLFGGSVKLAILVFVMTANFVTTMADVVAAIPREEFDHARTIRMSEWRTVWEVVVLGRAAEAFEVLRQNAAIGWMMLTAVEVISQAGGGIGLVLYKANRQFERMPEVFAILVVILAVGYLQDRAITWLKQTVCPYSTLTLERG